ncbi:hypothetical protein FIV07_10330 [Mycobacterium sp. THAF192]|nr:hypothetical protein FIV07_10330 [Mycobacterium sp. THAF192]
MSDTVENTDTTEAAPEGDVSNATPEAAHQADTTEGVRNLTPEGSDTESDPDDAGLSRRDIKYRERLRETEAERDTLRATVETLQRREVERLAAEHLVKPGSLWTVGVELASLLDDDGAVDPEKVSAAAADARQQHGLEDPQAARKRQPRVPLEGRGNTQAPKSAWADAFK